MVEESGNIALLAFDADGVMTDGRIIIDRTGSDARSFDVQDGMGIALWRQAGGKTAVVSGRTSEAVARRAAELNIDVVYQGRKDKLAAIKQVLTELQVSAEDACFVGDDLPDLPAMRHCGYAIAVANAVSQVKMAATYVTRKTGGQGALRETVEHLLKHNRQWDRVLAEYCGDLE
jgi:3-deoxy-D-manno-octulosonate 8-phosphate phosphatase (KDO 8-P phosphatase)